VVAQARHLDARGLNRRPHNCPVSLPFGLAGGGSALVPVSGGVGGVDG